MTHKQMQAGEIASYRVPVGPQMSEVRTMILARSSGLSAVPATFLGAGRGAAQETMTFSGISQFLMSAMPALPGGPAF